MSTISRPTTTATGTRPATRLCATSRRPYRSSFAVRSISWRATGATISVGVAVVQPTLRRNPRGALQLADQALYEAKAKGRNRVELMDDAEYRMLGAGVFS